MQTLYLCVEDRIRVDPDTVVCENIVCKLLLFELLYPDKFIYHCIVIGVLLKLAQLVKILYPVIITEQPCYKGRQLFVAKCEPAPLCDAVGLVLESLGVQLIPALQGVCFEYLCVYLRHAVCAA